MIINNNQTTLSETH